MSAPRATAKPLEMLEALCVCGHTLGEHLPWWRTAHQPCAWSRLRGYDGTDPDPPTKPCDCAGFVPRFRVVQ